MWPRVFPHIRGHRAWNDRIDRTRGLLSGGQDVELKGRSQAESLDIIAAAPPLFATDELSCWTQLP
jgi:hypothetical protein